MKTKIKTKIKTVRFRITKSHLKNSRYMDHHDCPLARSMRSAGYTRINVGGFSAQGNKNKRCHHFKIPGNFAGKVFAAKPFYVTLERVLPVN